MLKTKFELSKYLFYFSLFFAVFLYGFFSSYFRFFPYKLFRDAFRYMTVVPEKHLGQKEWFYQKTTLEKSITIFDSTQVYNGPTLFPFIDADNTLGVKVIDMLGNELHKWRINWFDIWPDAMHIPKSERPVAQPGTHVHGIVMLDDGSIVFNFEHLGLVRMDVCGNVIWKNPYRTHHSVFLDDKNTLWISGQVNHTQALADYPIMKPIIVEPTLLNVTLDGTILQEIRLFSVLKDNGLEGLLYLSNLNNDTPSVLGDLLHLNDVEIFSSDMSEGFFKAGDILISLRNINTVMVLDPQLKVKFYVTGKFIRHHDPDFVDGNTISVYDNNNRAPESYSPSSKIVMIDAPSGKTSVYYDGSQQHPFFSRIMGSHQWLNNGNLLITDSIHGRLLEINKSGDIVWEYYNIVMPDYTGLIEEAIRLPEKYNQAFFKHQMEKCGE